MRTPVLDSQDRLVLPGGGGVPGIVFGPLSILAAMTLGIMGFQLPPGRPDKVAFLLGLSALLLLVGLLLVFGVTRITLDRERGKIHHWKGFLWFGSETESELGSIHRVLVQREAYKAKHGIGYTFDVSLDGPGFLSWKVLHCWDGIFARELGELLGDYLSVKLVDWSDGTRREVEPESTPSEEEEC